MGVLFFLGYTSVISRFGRNFSRPTVYCFFNVGNAPVSSYCQLEPAFCKAAFMASTAVCHIIRVDPILLEQCQGTALIAT
jgi:hypothetical protein